jgi:hypothetical protein
VVGEKAETTVTEDAELPEPKENWEVLVAFSTPKSAWYSVSRVSWRYKQSSQRRHIC